MAKIGDSFKKKDLAMEAQRLMSVHGAFHSNSVSPCIICRSLKRTFLRNVMSLGEVSK